MTVTLDYQRPSSTTLIALEDRFEVLKEIGDGSFGSVALARVRANGSNIARRGSLIAIKTMKKMFDSFAPCLELREVIFLRTLPSHAHLVPALDIFLDPFSKKLHICMEYMDGNLYQLMKAREHKCMDYRSVKSILYQILSGLDHIHNHNFFHRDIKPENILVSTSAPNDSAFSRYSALVTPPSTPPTYSIKIADFGLARETHSKLPYTTYVSTRWYRAPEVLLRAGEYSAPVDIWAIGAMAVEIATLKPLFPGGNEVDQVWRICEIMGSPGNWYTKTGTRVGGGDWREGTKLAQKLGFSFPKMAPHAMETILPPPQWPTGLSNFVTWCLMWDPKNRPTSKQALEHEFFADAVDPLRPKSSSRLLGRKHSDLSFKSKESHENPVANSKPSWFRRSIVARDSAVAVPQQESINRPALAHQHTDSEAVAVKVRPQANKRATWTNGTAPPAGAPMPILPSIKPVSPMQHAVNVKASSTFAAIEVPTADVKQRKDDRFKKLGRQLSVNSHGNHYSDAHRLEAERALNGSASASTSGLMSPPYQKESFFSHLRKKARRFSGRPGLASPNADDVEATAGAAPWSNRSSVIVDSVIPEARDFADLDQALANVRYSLERNLVTPEDKSGTIRLTSSPLKRTRSVQNGTRTRSTESLNQMASPVGARTRRALQMSTNPVHQYETPEEADELLDEALTSANHAATRIDHVHRQAHRPALLQKDNNRVSMPQLRTTLSYQPISSYPTPSPSAKRDGVFFNNDFGTTQPLNINKQRSEHEHVPTYWPTPPHDESDWARVAAASAYNSQPLYR